MGKQILITQRPQVSQGISEEDWLHGRQDRKNIPMKRLTIDISEDLHKAIKTSCAASGNKIADEVRWLLICKYAAETVRKA